MRLIDADTLERDGWRMSRIVPIDEKTMELQTRKPTDFPAVEPQPEAIRCKECLMHGVCRFEQGLGLDGYCSQAERRTDDTD